MRHLSRHIKLNCGYFGYFRSQNDLPTLKQITAIVFVFGNLKMFCNCHFFTAAEAVRQIHEYASKLDDVDSDLELMS